MHNALVISEVFSYIVGYLAEDTDEDGRQALAVLARTCRLFSKPAVNALWHSLESLKPFMLCLPTKASYEDTTIEGALPPFNDEEWNVVSRYAPLVQELTLEHDDISIKILQSLWFRTTLFLPNLRKLYWSYGDDAAIAFIRLLLSPSLVDLHVYLEDGDHTTTLAFFESYHTFCPNLKSLHFKHSCQFPHVTTAVSRAVARAPNIEILECDQIDEMALIQVAESRRLKQFCSSLCNYQPVDLKRLAVRGTPDRPPFENVRVFELQVQDLSSIIPFFRSQHQPFEEVLFRCYTIPTHEMFYPFFSALSSPTRRETLRLVALSVSRMVPHDTDIPVQPIDISVLSPLTTLNLHQLYININNPISLNDDALDRLTRAWPDLEVLSLNEFSGWEYPLSVQLPTLRGLLRLLGCCPKLSGLALCLDATTVPSLSEEEVSIRNTTITRFSVANSPIQEPERVACFLLEHLPSLNMVHVCPSATGHYQWVWRSVHKRIQENLGQGESPEWSDDEMDI